MGGAVIGAVVALWSWARARTGRQGLRDLRRELDEQATEDYWRQREQRQSQHMQIVGVRHNFAAYVSGERDRLRIIRSSVLPLLQSGAMGAVLVGAVLALEWLLARRIAPWLVPVAPSDPPLAAFPVLAVQVLATFLGFYLAAVSIVLGQSYHDVSAAVRSLILGNRETRLYLGSIGLSIGVGLVLVVVRSVDLLTYGYATIGLFVILVFYSGWSVFKLTGGAFNLSNPVALAVEPLQAVYRSISRLDATGLLGDEAVRRAAARRADDALEILAELIRLTKERESTNRDQLAALVEGLLLQVRFYANRKHKLRPTSGWFLPEPAYPRWIEADRSEMLVALQTSTPLRERIEPARDWFEKRSAELVAQAIEACVATRDLDAALRMTRAAMLTARTLVRHYRVEDALAFYEVIRDHCREIESKNETSQAIASEPPLILTDMLVGWNEAIATWPAEVVETVARTDWDRRSTSVVEVRGPARVWTAAQQMLKEIHAEHDVEGRRVTPDWHLESALASECILALRELADQVPGQFDNYVRHLQRTPSPPEARLAIGLELLQSLAKADVFADTAAHSIDGLRQLCRGYAPDDVPEVHELASRIDRCRSSILELMGQALVESRPEDNRSKPDYFGHAWFTLVHHVQEAIASGDTELVQRVFGNVFHATFKMYGHVMTTYTEPTYRLTPAHVDSVIDLLEVSGLAIIYEALRNDQSAAVVRAVWRDWLTDPEHGKTRAETILTIVDYRRGSLIGTGIQRTEWSMRLATDIVDAGYARPEDIPFEEPPDWQAPLLIKMLGVWRSMPNVSLDPYVLFAGEVIGPLSTESDATLQERPGLRLYYQQKEFENRKRRPANPTDGQTDKERETEDG